MKRRSRSLWISLLLAVILTIGSLAVCRSGGPAGSAKPQENASVLQTVTDDAEQENQEDLQQFRIGAGIDVYSRFGCTYS